MEAFIHKTRNSFIFISGSIGVGKTTIMDVIQYILPKHNGVLIKEYIDYDPKGESMLNKHLNNEISPFEFQKYIVDCFFNQLEKYQRQTIIVERHPLESLIFAIHTLTKKEYNDLKNYIINLCEIYEVPLMNQCTLVIMHDIDINDIENFVRDVVNDVDDIVISVSLNESKQIQNIRNRGRESDTKYLIEKDLKYLRSINEGYRKARIHGFCFDDEYDLNSPVILTNENMRKKNNLIQNKKKMMK